MLIQIQYFAHLRDFRGPDSIELEEGSAVQDLLNKLFLRTPGLGAWNKHLLIAAGTEWVGRDYLLKPGETISLMPPVQGG